VSAADLDKWLPNPSLRVIHRRESAVPARELWQAASEVSLSGQPPFIVLDEGECTLVCGLVGRIWTLRRDYPQLGSPQEFANWSEGGTARVVIANWATDRPGGGSALTAEARVEPVGAQGRLGVAAVRPVVRAFQNLVGADGINAAVRRAERG
jgi:hypothetical protein